MHSKLPLTNNLERALGKKIISFEVLAAKESGSGSPEVVFTLDDGTELAAYINNEVGLCVETD